MTTVTSTPWTGPAGPRERFTWNGLLWALVFPQRSHRIVPTVPGVVLVSLSLGIGMAAYNSSSNILFLTLALLLACLVLSGVLSWLNLRGVSWRLAFGPALRAGHDTLVNLHLRNAKSFLPTYGLWFNLRAKMVPPADQLKPETTLTARSADIRAALAAAEAAEIHGRVALETRLDPTDEDVLEWVFQPRARGRMRLELVSVGSLFPFGFLRKDVGVVSGGEVLVWPAPIEYQRHFTGTSPRQAGVDRVARPGSGNDLLALRRYAAGDSHRLIHWKASARVQQLLVRQFGAESADGFSVALPVDRDVWKSAEQFEILIRMAATLSEDLFRAGRLVGVSIGDEPLVKTRTLRDVEAWLDRLALVQPAAETGAGAATKRTNVITFVPEASRGVSAWVNGVPFASA